MDYILGIKFALAILGAYAGLNLVAKKEYVFLIGAFTTYLMCKI